MKEKFFSYTNNFFDPKIYINIMGIRITLKKRGRIKLGVAYNLFDGEELLEPSIKSIRNAVDYVCVIYQKKSYYNEPASPDIEKLLNDLKSKGLIDEIYLYERDFSNASANTKIFEKEKRDIGLKLCKKAGMTHFFTADVDEFYDENELQNAKRLVAQNGVNASAIRIYEYLKYPEYRIIDDFTFTTSSPYDYLHPFIMKIHAFHQKHGGGFPAYTDPTKTLNGNEKLFVFPVQIIVQHHMCTIRKDLDKKYKNSTYNASGSEITNKTNEIKRSVLDWVPENNRIGNSQYYDFNGKIVKKVEDKFGINKYIKKEEL